MKRFLTILLLLIIPLFSPIFISAADTNSATSITPSYTCTFQKYTDPNIFSIIWTWIVSIFEKPYNIEPNRDQNTKIQDMTNYGNINDPEFKNKHSSAASRATTNNTQDCLKGKIINDVLRGQANDKFIGTICLDNSGGCTDKKISDLALYLTQTNQKFICDQNDIKINTPSDLLTIVNSKTSIPFYELPCYEGIYDDFYLTPVLNISNSKENIIKIMNQPIPYQSQDQNANLNDQEAKINNLFSYQSDIDNNKATGLPGLVPEYW